MRLLKVSTHRDLYFPWRCLHYRGLSCISTCLHCATSGHVYTKKGLCCTWTCLHHRGRSCTLTCLHCRGLPFFWSCLHYRGLSCIWTCLRYRSLCCTWTCLYTPQWAGAAPGLVYTSKGCAAPGGVYTTGPELCLDLSTLQWLVLVLDSIRENSSSIPWNGTSTLKFY